MTEAYDGVSVMHGATGGVRRKIQEIYSNTFIHCYAYQLNLVMQTAISLITPMHCFFSDIADIYLG